jgi:hypothetical protein
MNDIVYLLWTGQYDNRTLVGVYTSTEAAHKALLQMALADMRPEAPEVEERDVYS